MIEQSSTDNFNYSNLECLSLQSHEQFAILIPPTQHLHADLHCKPLRMNSVLASTQFVVAKAKSVKISEDGLIRICDEFALREMPHWLEEAPFCIQDLPTPHRIPFLFVLNSISFCYWGQPNWSIEYDARHFNGAWGLILCLAKAMKNGSPLFDARYLSHMPLADFQEITKGSVHIPLEEERLAILNELGCVIGNFYDGNFTNLVEEAGYNAQRLLRILVSQITSFRDVQEYCGRSVIFNKRAQLLVSDINYALGIDNTQPRQALTDIETLTACADYKLPQVLRRYGALIFDRQLDDKVDRCVLLGRNSDEEIEIRANTIWAVEHIRRRLSKQRPGITSSEINDYLWLLGQVHHPDDRPYHRTITTAY